jgi:hypothetical protein
MRSRKGKKKARLGAPPRRGGAAPSAAAAAAAAPINFEHDPSALYGLYSTTHEDYSSGAWFPLNYVGPAPPAATVVPDPDDDGSSGNGVPPSDDDILVRWHAKSQVYAPERLALPFVRGGSEFQPLPESHQKVGKRVLVRDVLEDLDFVGPSFWLATITAEPAVPAAAATSSNARKRTSSGARRDESMVGVSYHNALWPATSVPSSSIFVLPKARMQLALVPEVETDELRARRIEWEARERAEMEVRRANAANHAAAAAASSSSGATVAASPSTVAASASLPSHPHHSDDLLAPSSSSSLLTHHSPRAAPFAFGSPSSAAAAAGLGNGSGGAIDPLEEHLRQQLGPVPSSGSSAAARDALEEHDPLQLQQLHAQQH